LLAVVLGLGSSLCWGLADFFGGLQSRRISALAVLLISQAIALALLAPFVVLLADDAPGADAVGWSVLAGCAGVVALGAFYRGLAVGPMSIVAPVSATGAAVPILVGLAEGERPTAVQVAGMVLALVGIVLAAREPAPSHGHEDTGSRTGIALGFVAAVGFGTFFVGVDRAAETADIPWVMAVARSSSILLVLAAALALRPALPRRPAALLPLAVIGVLDLGANGLYALATREGLLSIVSVLGSLYPAVTVVLARVVLGERVTRVQEAGVLATLAGVVAISAG